VESPLNERPAVFWTANENGAARAPTDRVRPRRGHASLVLARAACASL